MVLYIYIIRKFIITYIVNKILPKPAFNALIKILRTICLAFLCCVVLYILVIYRFSVYYLQQQVHPGVPDDRRKARWGSGLWWGTAPTVG